MQLEGLFKHSVEEGLGQTLLAEHTPEEVRIVLQYIFKDVEKADSVLSTLIPYSKDRKSVDSCSAN